MRIKSKEENIEGPSALMARKDQKCSNQALQTVEQSLALADARGTMERRTR
jgi:hypothetical protein